MNTSCTSSSILLGFKMISQKYETNDDLLKNYLAGDNSNSVPTSKSVSLFPAHFVSKNKNDSVNTEEWLLRDAVVPTPTSVAPLIADAPLRGKDNIMAPVLKATSADYWLDRRNANNSVAMDEGADDEARPPVAERVPDPFLSLWLANPTKPAAEADSVTETGESSPKKARIEWPKNLVESTSSNWLAGTGAATTVCPRKIKWPEHLIDVHVDEWLANKGQSEKVDNSQRSAKSDLGNKWLAFGGSGDRIEWPNNITKDSKLDNWLSVAGSNPLESEKTANPSLWPATILVDNVDYWLKSDKMDNIPDNRLSSANSNVDAWLTEAMEEFSLEDPEEELEGTSSIEILEAADYDLESACDGGPNDNEEGAWSADELAKWLIVN